MMIDFALEAERANGLAPRARGDLPGLPAALPADPDDHHGGAGGALPLMLGAAPVSELRRRWASPWSAACSSARC